MLVRLPSVATGCALALSGLGPVLTTRGADLPGAAAPTAPLVTTRDDPAARLVNQWYAEGTAAGNRGDRYDNRDSGHSLLNPGLFPQLQPVSYTPEEVAQRRNQGPPGAVLPFPTLGNASLAAPATNGGSIPRIISLTPAGLRLLQAAYFSNNLYVFPEHQDHDPPLGDLFPLNTPYVVISQGSSFSDQPFLEALALTSAAFRPEVKEELVRSRLLAPTLQFLLRASLKTVQSRDDYLSGLAHPTVFAAEWIDAERMVRAAHQMTREAIPPLVQLALVYESPAPRPGIDAFEPPQLSSEVLANENSVIARVFRSTAPERVLRVSAIRTADLLGRPVRVFWRLLRGDPRLVTLQASPSGHEAEIRIRYHPKPLPTPGQPQVRSSRVDVAAFADNGVCVSAPGFVSMYFLPSEERVFDERGRLVQIDYQAPSRHHELPPATSGRWATLVEAICNPRAGWCSQFLGKVVTEAERAQVQSFASQAEALLAARQALEAQLQAEQETAARLRAQGARLGPKGAPAASGRDTERRQQDRQRLSASAEQLVAGTRSKLAALEQEWERALRRRTADGQPFLDLLTGIVDRLVDSPDLFPGNQALLAEHAKNSPKPGAEVRLRQVRQRLVDRRVLLADRDAPDVIVSCAPLAKPENRPYLRALNRTILADILLPGVLEYSFADEFADPRLTVPKPWRDVFHYDSQSGELRGWERIRNGEVSQYDADGRRLAPQGAFPVSYRVDPQTGLLNEVAGAAQPLPAAPSSPGVP